MEWLSERGAAEIFLLGMAALFVLALVGAAIGALVRGARAAGGAFKRGWDSTE